MTSIKNVAIVGGTGALGSVVLKTLVESGLFTVTAITRTSSTAVFPSSVKVIKVDYDSVEELIFALKGQDALVLAIGISGLLIQYKFFDAAIAAGVKRVLPSEFGCDLEKAGSLPVFIPKLAARKSIEEKIAVGADISYTYIVNNSFLDWCLKKSFLLNLQSTEPTLYGSGDFEFSTTTLATVARAVVGVLTHPEETKNRTVRVEDIAISQNQILALAKKVAPTRTWNPVSVDLDDIEQWTNIMFCTGNHSMDVMVGYLFVAIFQSKYGGRFETTDNELLGIKGITEVEVEEILKDILASNEAEAARIE